MNQNPKTILYIEDNEDNAIIVESIVKQAGYDVYTAYDGAEGIALAEEHQPDLIISDFHLPGMTGPEIIAALREKPQFTSTPVIMFTADIYSNNDSHEVDVDRYLYKPIRRNQLLKAIEKLLG